MGFGVQCLGIEFWILIIWFFFWFLIWSLVFGVGILELGHSGFGFCLGIWSLVFGVRNFGFCDFFFGVLGMGFGIQRL